MKRCVAVWLAGAAVVPLPLPMRLGSVEEFVAQTRGRILDAEATIVVADALLAELLDSQEGDPPVAVLDDLRGSPARYERPVDDPDALAILKKNKVRAKIVELKALERSILGFVISCDSTCAGGPGPDCAILDDLSKAPTRAA